MAGRENSEQGVPGEIDALIAGVAAARPGLVVHRDHDIRAAGVEALEALRCLDLRHGDRQAGPIRREQAERRRDETRDGGGEGADGHVPHVAVVEGREVGSGPLELGFDDPGVVQQHHGLGSEPDPPPVSGDEWHSDRACQRGDLLGHRRGAEVENPSCRGDRLVVSEGLQRRELPEIDDELEWVPTPVALEDPAMLGAYGGCLMAPGTPYASMAGALEAIRYAREHDLALPGTCGGFQHVVIEIARNLAGIAGADHAEMNPDASELVCVPLDCSLVGQQHTVRIEPGTRAAAIYGTGESIEPFFCNFGLNDAYRPALEVAATAPSTQVPAHLR